MDEIRESCAVLTISGINESEMLVRLAALASELNLNIEEAIGHTLADTVVLYAMMSGDDDKLARTAAAAEAMFEGLTVYAEVRKEQPLPLGQNMEKMLPFPWRITVHSPDVRGLLLELAEYISKRGLQIISYRGEKFTPARSVGNFATLQMFIVRVPSDFDRMAFMDDFNTFSVKQGYLNVALEPI